ncbi:MAG: tetratricopeptide repeat protein [Saprospiraceae bacterium]|nr:tetratricopeptide repeat protein [Saprospiraceae bacterium]
MLPIYRFYSLLLFLIFSSNSIHAQDQKIVDSLLQLLPNANDTTQCNIYVELYRNTFQHDLSTAGEYATKCVDAAEKSGNLSSIAQSNNLLGIHQLQTSDYNNAITSFNEAIKSYRKLDKSDRVFRAMNNLAIVYENQGKLDASLNTHFQVLRFLDSLGVGGDMLASSMWNIGNVKHNLLKHEESIEWYEKARAIYQESGDTEYIIDLNHQIALSHAALRNLDEAEKGFDDCIQYYRQKGMEVALAGSLENISEVYILTGRYQEAEENLMEALSIAEKEEAGFLPGQIYRRLVELYLAMGELNKAERYGKISIENAKAYGRDKKLIADYQLLSQVYERKGQLRPALDYYKSYHTQNDSIFGLEKLNAINDLQLEYQEFKNQQEVKLLEEQNRVAQLKQNGLIAGIIAITIILGALIFALRQRLSKNRIAKEKVQQELEFNQKELTFKQKELTAYALQIAQKNEVLEGVKTKVAEVENNNPRQLQRIINTINFNQNDDDSWEGFRQRFVALHKDFESIVKKDYPEVTANELRLMSLLKMNLSNKEIANILNVSADGIKKARYRLRKKLALETSDSLESFILEL